MRNTTEQVRKIEWVHDTERTPEKTLTWRPRTATGAPVLIWAALALATGPAAAQDTGAIEGTVVSADDEAPVAGASVEVRGPGTATTTVDDGGFRLEEVPAGEATLDISMLAYRDASVRVEVAAGDVAHVTVELEPRPIDVGGIDVSVVRPDLQPQAELAEREIARANPKDAGEILRRVGGLDAVRRGALGLDPVVRGARETEIGTFLDGTRMFPAGPARMDSPLTHLDPSSVESIDVVKGPYALTWGAGNVAAIRVETDDLPPPGVRGPRGRVQTGYDSNLEAFETSATTSARSGRLAAWGHGAWRQGSDYETGGGETVPADFEAWEARGRVGVDLSERSRISVGGGYQERGPIDYPGRLLNADYFDAHNLSVRYTREGGGGVLDQLEALAYWNGVDHGMGNWDKPTAEPMEDRMPPFPLDIRAETSVDVRGGRLAADLNGGTAWRFRVGGDVYHAERDAVRTIQRGDGEPAPPGAPVPREDRMWPGAEITEGGVFAQANRSEGALRLSGTVRLDGVRATADPALVTDFFTENVTEDLRATEVNPSASATAGYDLTPEWSVSAGVGSVARTADANERYSDRIPSTRMQTSAEFMGDPSLEPERTTQADLWIERRTGTSSVEVNVFARQVDDHITLEATELEKALPLSPDTVFAFTNGEAALWGGEASVLRSLGGGVTGELGASYLRGRDRNLGEPMLGISPLRGQAGLRYENPAGTWFLEGLLWAASSQERVAVTRGEERTSGHTTVDLRAGWSPLDGVQLRFGVENALDAEYTNHLNASNPFTGDRIPEPGRVFVVEAAYRF